jgi:hypothetical protein
MPIWSAPFTWPSPTKPLRVQQIERWGFERGLPRLIQGDTVTTLQARRPTIFSRTKEGMD